jgi:hypothetical protein
MTTGSNRATPGRRGAVPTPGDQRGRREMGALPSGPGRALRSLLHQLVHGRDPEPGITFGPCDRSAEAGS